MPAYWVARSKINDPVEYKKYADRDPNIIVIRRRLWLAWPLPGKPSNKYLHVAENCSAGNLPNVGGSASSSYTTSWDTTLSMSRLMLRGPAASA